MTTPTIDLQSKLKLYQQELLQELDYILEYWVNNTVDKEFGGFVGQIDEDNLQVGGADKGAVLNARILWTFAAAFNHKHNPDHLDYAERAYAYICDHFIDKEQGGVFWTVNHIGKPKDTKKQVYAIAFTIYGLAEYFTASQDPQALDVAKELYQSLENYAFDSVNGGYFEAFSREWTAMDDLRLSARDANEKKTMNTHLHVLEAYTNLYRIWPEPCLRDQTIKLIHNFLDHMIDPETGHLILFLDEEWNKKSVTISFGHDIEASWLLLEAAEALNDLLLIGKVKEVAMTMAKASMDGMDNKGGMYYELDPLDAHLIREKHWWVQAEAMVGFINAWQLSQRPEFAEEALRTWEFIKGNLLDDTHGEWYWGIDENGMTMAGEDKAGLWKCPYHNSRACLEIIQRLKGLI